jgi:hypothetical protein
MRSRKVAGEEPFNAEIAKTQAYHHRSSAAATTLPPSSDSRLRPTLIGGGFVETKRTPKGDVTKKKDSILPLACI